MSRIYTGQHGEFWVQVNPNTLGEGESYDISANGRTGQLIIDDIGRVSGNDRTNQQRANERREAWTRAGWRRANNADYPTVGDVFAGNGSRATVGSSYSWSSSPSVRQYVDTQWVKCGQVRNWSFSNTAETIDSTRLGDTFREKLGGLKSMTGQAQLMYYREDDDSNSPVSDLLDVFYNQDSEIQRGDLKVRFRLVQPASSNRNYEFNAILTNWSMACSVGEVVTVDVSFEGMGAPRGSSPRM